MEKTEAIIWDWMQTLCQSGGKLFPYTEKVLGELKPRYKMSVISKATSDNVENRWKQIKPLEGYFVHTIVDVIKTPEQFLECMSKMDVKPENTLVVDDRIDRGIQIGNSLGCVTAWIKNGKYSYILPNKETGEPTYKINSVEDLLTIL